MGRESGMSDEVEVVEACALCGPVDTVVDERFGRYLGLIPPYAVRRCTRCGLRWLSPRPTAAAYERLYEYESYFSGPGAVEQYRELANARLPHFRARIERIERHFPSEGGGLAILDIGAATGEFVAEARARGHDAEGIELSEGARGVAERVHGVELSGERLEALDRRPRFDVIHMNHVLEHLANPADALAICAQLLRPGGLMVLEVPRELDNDLERLKRVLGMGRRRAFDVYSLHHTYYFTPSTMAALISESGFEVRSLATANIHRTPLWPPSLKNLLLGVYLWLSDRIHRGGNIIEVYARRAPPRS